jgi:4-hydroxybenzoate polyprenyltransferase
MRGNMSEPSIATSVALPASDGEPPIVVDLDETLIRTDLLIESFFILLASHPVAAVAALNALRRGKAAFKSKLADAAVVEVETLPLNEEVVGFLKAEKSKGRPLYLASASDRRYAERVADHLGLFDGVFGSDAAVNLAGPLKADRLCKMFGERGFDYIGNGLADEAVWRRARRVYVANASPAYLAAVRTWAPEARALGTRAHQWQDYVHTLRVHQWLKNILVFAPALAAHQPTALISSLLAFISFSLCASSVYVLNDLFDLRYDRAHPRKRLRPLAAGRIRIVHGSLLFPLLLLASLVVALFLPMEFVLVLTAYFILTCAYSLDLKRRMLIDVITLACLYGSRLVAGGAATGIRLSPWLVAFAIFLFFSLAIIKRCAELGDHLDKDKGDPVGRGYRVDDLPVLQSMAIASGYLSVLVLALYINGDVAGTLYRHPDTLWLNCILLLFWVSRMIMVTHRGRMRDDPLVFAATDRISQLVLLSCIMVTISAMT